MAKTIACIGAGTMAGAILKGACRTSEPARFLLTDVRPEKARALASDLGCATAASNREAAGEADLILLCVKPQAAAAVLEELAPVLRDTQKPLVSILAGVTIATIRTHLDAPAHPVIRVMPNTPALIGKGTMLLAYSDHVSEEAREDVLTLLAPCGETLPLAESLFDQGTALSGSAPAFVYRFIDALAAAGAEAGLPPEKALHLAARAAYGAAAMVLETGESPAALKTAVCSPGGSTIAGIEVLDAADFMGIVRAAIQASIARNKELGNVT